MIISKVTAAQFRHDSPLYGTAAVDLKQCKIGQSRSAGGGGGGGGSLDFIEG